MAAVLLLSALLPAGRAAADSYWPKDVIEQTGAVAYVRIVKVEDELHGETVVREVTLSLCGGASGLGEAREVTVRFLVGRDNSSNRPFSYGVGERCVMLFGPKKDGWDAEAWLYVDEDGKFLDENVGRELGLKPGMEANAVVEIISAKVKKEDRNTVNRPRPPPTARNQPWNLMHASPLRRVWPFFPH